MTYADVVSEDFQMELMQIEYIQSGTSWRLGDIVNIIEQQVASRSIPSSMVYKAVALFSGKSARTIREYSAIASHYPMNIREIYQVLSFDHFRTAMQFGDRDLDALEWAVNQTERLGRPATVDSMEAHFANPTDMNTEPNVGEWTIVDTTAEHPMCKSVVVMTVTGIRDSLVALTQLGETVLSDDTIKLIRLVLSRIAVEIQL